MTAAGRADWAVLASSMAWAAAFVVVAAEWAALPLSAAPAAQAIRTASRLLQPEKAMTACGLQQNSSYKGSELKRPPR